MGFGKKNKRFIEIEQKPQGRVSSKKLGNKRESVYKVFVKHSGRADIDFVLSSLRELLGSIVPLCIDEDDRQNVFFYVSKKEEAENIMMLSRRIAHPSDSLCKFTIITAEQPSPWEMLDMKVKVAVREVVKSRYNADSKLLNLRNFQSDRFFLQNDLNSICSLSRNAIMVEAIRAAAEFFPDISGISLKNNHLTTLQYVRSFVYACPYVIELDLSDNELDKIEDLDLIRCWEIQRLALENNSFNLVFSDDTSYANFIQDYFPRLTYLDGMQIQPNARKLEVDLRRRQGFSYPPPQITYCPDIQLRGRIEQLLWQYYELYDGSPLSKSRQMLLQAYDENAVFTVAICMLYATKSKQVRRGNEDVYTQYTNSTRNLCVEAKWARNREKMIFKGALAIAVALGQLPATKHDKESIQIEFVTVRQEFVVVNVRGIISDGKDMNKPFGIRKFFSRSFTIVAKGDDKMAIVNDILMLSPVEPSYVDAFISRSSNLLNDAVLPSYEPAQIVNQPVPIQTVNVFSQPAPGFNQPAPIFSQPVPIVNIPPSIPMFSQPLAEVPTSTFSNLVAPSNVSSVENRVDVQFGQSHESFYDRNDASIQQAMVEAFSQQSRMKIDWARKCLEDSHWDFEAAGRIFNQLRADIPKDAFM